MRIKVCIINLALESSFFLQTWAKVWPTAATIMKQIFTYFCAIWVQFSDSSCIFEARFLFWNLGDCQRWYRSSLVWGDRKIFLNWIQLGVWVWKYKRRKIIDRTISGSYSLNRLQYFSVLFTKWIFTYAAKVHLPYFTSYSGDIRSLAALRFAVSTDKLTIIHIRQMGWLKAFANLSWLSLLFWNAHLICCRQNVKIRKIICHKITHFTILDLFTLEYYVQLSNLTCSLSFIYNMFIPKST